MSLLLHRREVGEFKTRYKWMALVVLVVFGALFVRMLQLQLLEASEWSEIAQDNITKTFILPASRGVIRDMHGDLVATNRPSYDVYITPQLLNGDEGLQRVTELMRLNQEQAESLKHRLEAVPLRRRTHQIRMFRDITRDQLAALETHSRELPGVDVLAVPVRTYPHGNLGAHVVGYLNEVNAEDLERHPDRGYRAGEVIGRNGVESAWEETLRGRRGLRRALVDARGRLQLDRVPEGVEADAVSHVPPVPGQELALTLDMDLMATVSRAFRGHPSGAAVVVEVNTGRVRALFSKPAYDLNEMAGRLSQRRFDELRQDPFRPLIDKTVYESYFPGSTFKPISALAALADNVVDRGYRVDCPGYYELGNRRFRCTQVHGEVDMESAMIGSCNIYFWRLAEQVGLERLNRYARQFGFGESTGIGINTEASGFLATREWFERRYGRFRLGHTLNAAIGQGNTRATLVQIAIAYAAIANGGTLYRPQIVERTLLSDGQVVEEFEPEVTGQVEAPVEDLEYLTAGLWGVVNNEDGTAFDARVEGGVTVAGKTGTAQVSRHSPREGESPSRIWYLNRDHAWFAGFAPASRPLVSIVVLVEHGGAGGRTAAPIGTRILQEYLGDDVEASESEAGAE